MEDAPLRIVESKENMENKSEIEKCINDCIREKQTRLTFSAARYHSISDITAKGKQQ